MKDQKVKKKKIKVAVHDVCTHKYSKTGYTTMSKPIQIDQKRAFHGNKIARTTMAEKMQKKNDSGQKHTLENWTHSGNVSNVHFTEHLYTYRWS